MTTKTDNGNLNAKLDLRRHMLRKYHGPDGDPIRVMDCCQGSGVIWSRLRKEFEVIEYFGLDVKPKAGRLKVDSTRVLAQHGWCQTVIDVDTYGSPFKHWNAMLPNIFRPTTVFLTIGRGGLNMIRLAREELSAMGITMPMIHRLSGAITRNLGELSIRHSLARAARYGLEITEAVEAVSGGNARYVGVRVSPVARA